MAKTITRTYLNATLSSLISSYFKRSHALNESSARVGSLQDKSAYRSSVFTGNASVRAVATRNLDDVRMWRECGPDDRSSTAFAERVRVQRSTILGLAPAAMQNCRTTRSTGLLTNPIERT